jgi:hypothetical protein
MFHFVCYVLFYYIFVLFSVNILFILFNFISFHCLRKYMPAFVAILDLIDLKNLSVFDAVRKLFFVVRFPKDNPPGETGIEAFQNCVFVAVRKCFLLFVS